MIKTNKKIIRKAFEGIMEGSAESLTSKLNMPHSDKTTESYCETLQRENDELKNYKRNVEAILKLDLEKIKKLKKENEQNISNLQGENTILNIKLGQEEEKVRELQNEIEKLKNPRCDCKTQKWIEEQYED